MKNTSYFYRVAVLMGFLSLFSAQAEIEQAKIEINVNGTKITLVQGDILTQNVDAIVNPANTRLDHCGGLAAKIRDAAGGQPFQEFCDRLLLKTDPYQNQNNKLSVGCALLTEGFKLNKKIIHVVGPDTRIDWQDRDKVFHLQTAYMNALYLAKKHKIRTIAFPSISTGIFEFDINQAAPIAIEEVINYLKNIDTGITEVRFVMFDQNDFEVYKRILESSVILAQPTMAQPTMEQPTAACIIEKGLFHSDFYITFIKDQVEGEVEKSISFSIPVKIEEKKRFVRFLNKQIEKLCTEKLDLIRSTPYKKLEVEEKDSKIKDKRKKIDEKNTALREIVVLLDAISDAITNDIIIERSLKQEYTELKDDDKELVFKECPFDNFANYKKLHSYLSEEEGFIKYLENESRKRYLKEPLKVEIADKQISNDLYEKIEKLEILCNKHFYITLQGDSRHLLTKILTSKKAWLAAVAAGLGYFYFLR